MVGITLSPPTDGTWQFPGPTRATPSAKTTVVENNKVVTANATWNFKIGGKPSSQPVNCLAVKTASAFTGYEQVSLSGPNGTWGIYQISVGMVQNVVSSSAIATYGSGNASKTLKLEPSAKLPLLDLTAQSLNQNRSPFYYPGEQPDVPGSLAVFCPTPEGTRGVKLGLADAPSTYVPLTYPTTPPGGDLTGFTEALGFSVYIVAQTSDSANNANQVFSALASHDWTVNFKATPAGNNWNATQTESGEGQKQTWTILTAGSPPPRVSGQNFNAAFCCDSATGGVWTG